MADRDLDRPPPPADGDPSPAPFVVAGTYGRAHIRAHSQEQAQAEAQRIATEQPGWIVGVYELVGMAMSPVAPARYMPLPNKTGEGETDG